MGQETTQVGSIRAAKSARRQKPFDLSLSVHVLFACQEGLRGSRSPRRPGWAR
jgi:hypothetical protein